MPSEAMNESAPEFPHLKNAPITEALIDFRVRLPAVFDIARLKEAHNQIKDRYPQMDEQKMIEQEFQLQSKEGQPPQCTVRDRGVIGYFFRSADQMNLVQFRRDGFTFNRLYPYTSWNEVFPEASRLWQMFVALAQPEEISRLAVRYINRVQLPLAQLDFSAYLTAPPALPRWSPQNVSSFLSRVVIHEPETGIAANIVQALEPPLNNDYISMILDIDVYEANVSELTPEAALSHFEKLREMKNRIFFGSLTDKAIALFQ
jgi:uncharacterized protein (TIGR04255 family)